MAVIIGLLFFGPVVFGEKDKKDAVKEPVKQSKNTGRSPMRKELPAEKPAPVKPPAKKTPDDKLREGLLLAWKKRYYIEIRRVERALKTAEERAAKGDQYEKNRLPQLKRRLLSLKKKKRELDKDKLLIKKFVFAGELKRHGDYYRIWNPAQTRSGPFYHVIGMRDGLKSLKGFVGKWCEFVLYEVERVGFTFYVYADKVKKKKKPINKKVRNRKEKE